MMYHLKSPWWNCKKQCNLKCELQSTCRVKRGVRIQRIGFWFYNLVIFPVCSAECFVVRRGVQTRQQVQGFVLSAKTSEAAKFSEDTSSLSQCQQEQEARCVLYAVIHLIYASVCQMSRDSCQLPGFHLVSIMLSCVMMCSINDTIVFGNSPV